MDNTGLHLTPWLTPLCVLLAPLVKAVILGDYYQLGCFCLWETKFPAKSGLKNVGFVVLTRSPEAGKFGVNSLASRVETLGFSWPAPHDHVGAAAAPSILHTHDNPQKQEEMSLKFVSLLMDESTFSESSHWPGVDHVPYNEGNGTA